MAQTTTAIDSCAVEVWLDTAGGVLTNISGSSTEIVPHFTQTLGDYHPRASDWPSRLDGGKDAGVRLNVVYSTTDAEGWDILKDWWFAASPGARRMRWYAPDKTAGADQFAGNWRIRDLRWTHGASAAGPVVVTADLVPDGEVTQSTYAS